MDSLTMDFGGEGDGFESGMDTLAGMELKRC